MKQKIQEFKPHSGRIKKWLVNASILCFAIGFFQENFAGEFAGAIFLAMACAVVFVEYKYLKKPEEEKTVRSLSSN